MPSGRGVQGGGVMDRAAQLRAQAMRTRKTLNVEQQAQAPVRQNPPPRQAKTTTAADQQQQQQTTPDERMKVMTQQFLQQIGQTRGQQPTNEPPARVTAPAAETSTVTDRLKAAGAEGLSSIQQFYRLAGRMPTPRELAVYQTAKMLEQQLNRRPTRVELQAALTRPTLLGPQVQSVVGV